MAKTLERIAQEVATMTRQERLTLVRLLLDLDQPVNGDEIARAWDIEISARVKAVDEGRVSGSNTYVVASFKPLRLPREIGERGRDFEAVQILCHTAVAKLAKAKDILDHPEQVLDLGSHSRLFAALRFLRLLTCMLLRHRLALTAFPRSSTIEAWIACTSTAITLLAIKREAIH